MARFRFEKIARFVFGLFGASAGVVAAALPYSLGPESVLFAGGGGDSVHVAFPHATLDDSGTIWLVYRKADTHAGSLGALWLAKYGASNMSLLSNVEVYKSDVIDSRDPTITVKDGIVYIAFFQYNYSFNMVREFVLMLDAKSGTRLGPEKMLLNRSIFNHSSSAPLSWVGEHWILPVYYVADFYSKNTDVGYFSFDRMLDDPNVSLTTIAKGAKDSSFFLEPAIAIKGLNWTALFRTSPVSTGPGGVAPMMRAESTDGGLSWSEPSETPFFGHHPRMSVDAQGRVWAAFRDLSDYDEKTYKAKITVWQMDDSSSRGQDSAGERDTAGAPAQGGQGTTGDGEPAAQKDRTITVFETTISDKNNWDCGYPSWLQIDEHTFRVVYYYDTKGKFVIASRLVTLKE